MDNAKNFIREHKKQALIALFLVIVFVGCSAVSAVNVAQQRAQEDISQEQPERKDNDGSEQPADGETDISLTDEQQEAIDGYDDDTKAFIDTLAASVWSANGGKNTLRFSEDNTYTETANGESQTHGFAILRLERGGDDAGAEVSTAVFETDTGTHVVTYTYLTGTAADGSGMVTSTLSSNSMFTLKGSNYERTDTVKSVTIKGLNSEMTTLFGDDIDKLTDDLSAWCATNYPTATEATWNQAAIIDYETGTVSTNFTLNTESATDIAVIYQSADGTFTFSD